MLIIELLNKQHEGVKEGRNNKNWEDQKDITIKVVLLPLEEMGNN
jgi:hypothetical protein